MAEIIEIENLTVDDSIELELESVPQVDIDFDGEVETIELEDFTTEGIAVENDPTVPKHVKNISQDNIAFWNGWETITNLDIERICAL
jgi:hypothetical protein